MEDLIAAAKGEPAARAKSSRQSAQSNLLPHLSSLNDRFSELSGVAPATSVFKSFIDPILVVATLYALHFAFQVTFDGYAIALACTAFLLSAQLLDGTFLFVPGEARPLLGLGRFMVSWSLIVAVLLLLGDVTGFADYFYPPYIVTWFLAAPAALLLVHLLCRPIFLSTGRSWQSRRRAVIVGANAAGLMLAQSMRTSKLQRYEFVGYFDDRSISRLQGLIASDLLGRLNDLPAYIKANNIHNVYISLPMTSQPRVMDLLEDLKDSTASIYFVPDFFVFDLIQARFDNIAGMPVVAVCESPFVGINGMLKRASDIVLSLIILAVIWPVMAIVAAAVKLTSPGPVLFRQRRYGADGQSIVVYKFRSMTVLEDGTNIRQAQRDDQRLTSIGAFLRRTSIDELPQFINVLQGRMSIVGPRPHANAHNEMYRKLIRGYMIRHKVRPGITGWAQVCGYRGETNTLDKMEQRIAHDLDYLRNWSIWLDIKIIVMTTLSVLRHRDAY